MINMKPQEEILFKPEDIVSVYTNEEAVEDGNLNRPRPNLKPKTSQTLLSQIRHNQPTRKRLLQPAKRTRRRKHPQHPQPKRPTQPSSQNLSQKTSRRLLCQRQIECPDGQIQRISIAENETGRYTAMFPEDY